MNEPDVSSYESYLSMLTDMTEEESKAYWKRENAKDNIGYINSLHHNIRLNNQIIANTKRWLTETVEQFKAGTIDEDKLRENLLLGGELIKGCEDDTGYTRAEIAHVTRYPLYSEKRRMWYKSKEGQAWLKKNLLKKN